MIVDHVTARISAHTKNDFGAIVRLSTQIAVHASAKHPANVRRLLRWMGYPAPRRARSDTDRRYTDRLWRALLRAQRREGM